MGDINNDEISSRQKFPEIKDLDSRCKHSKIQTNGNRTKKEKEKYDAPEKKSRCDTTNTEDLKLFGSIVKHVHPVLIGMFSSFQSIANISG